MGIPTLAAVCPKPPAGAQAIVDNLTGYVLFGVIALFVGAGAVCVGLIVAGKAGNSPMLTRGGVGGLVVVVMAAFAYVIFPGIVHSILGSGCM